MFTADQHRLPCLAHVINLAIIAIMLTITKTTAADTSSAIWEFDPMLPNNCVLGGSLDAVTAVRTLTVKIQASNQCIAYFERLQVECNIEKPLAIPLHSNIRWGTADLMLKQSYRLRQVCFIYHTVITSCTNDPFSARQPLHLISR
jgi:hypothetical protein